MSEVPLLLVDNGNYTSLADLTLRKIKALDSLPLEQRERLMSKDEYDHAREQCYSIILSLFAAIDQSISKETATATTSDKGSQDYIDYFLGKLNAIQNDNLKVHLREKIMKRIEQFNDIVVLSTLFDYLISRPKNQLNIEALPHLNDKTIYQLIDNALAAKQITRPKFDSIVKILLKKNQVERLFMLTNQACDNYFTVVSPVDGSVQMLSLQDKLNLVYTANTLLQTQKQTLSGEMYAQYLNRLNDLEDALSNQIMIITNIEELNQGLSSTINVSKDEKKVDLYKSYIENLNNLK
jgi:hypothetical protein